MATPYTKDFTGTAAYVALSSSYLGFQGSLGALPTNGSNLYVRIGSDAATELQLVPGEFWPLANCNIANIQIKGNGLVLRAVGVTAEGW